MCLPEVCAATKVNVQAVRLSLKGIISGKPRNAYSSPTDLGKQCLLQCAFHNQYIIKLTNTRLVNHTGAAAAASLVCSSRAFL